MAKEKLTYERKLVWDVISETEKKSVFDFASGYLRFLSEIKTEKEAVIWVEREAEKSGFCELKESGKNDKAYLVNRSSAVALAVLGRRPVRDGIRLIVSHIDAPRLDLKPQPLIEEDGLGLLKTHYYGGIKKYQWVTKPLSLHGIVVLKNGVKKEVVIGENENEPVLTVTDLLPHLAKDQMEKKMSEAVEGEALNLLVASLPVSKEKDKKDGCPATKRVKEAVLKILHQTASLVLIGANSVDFSGYPDCRPQFYRFLNRLVLIGTRAGCEGRKIQIITPLMYLSKANIIRLGKKLKVPYHVTWSCYAGKKKPCEKCDSCLLRKRGFAEAGIKDPFYAHR